MSIPKEWQDILPESTTDKINSLCEKVMKERAAGKTIYPPQDEIFSALEKTLPSKVKVVIVGQDPYHQQNQANGMAFSVRKGIVVPPSLVNIFKELKNDLGCSIPDHGDLSKWADEGVLLLNTSLTVEEGKAASHSSWGWQDITKDIIKACVELPQPVVFMLWGRHAQNMVFSLDCLNYGIEKKTILCSSHPSPLGATKPCGKYLPFLGSKPFSEANRRLVEGGSAPVDWQL